jgi:hypothetical protein
LTSCAAIGVDRSAEPSSLATSRPFLSMIRARRNATGVHDADRGALGDQEYRQPGDSVLLKEGQPAVVPQILTQNALLSELDRGQYNVFAKRH